MVAARFFVLFVAISCGQLCKGARVQKVDLEASYVYDPEENAMMFCAMDCRGKCATADCKKWCEIKGPMCMKRDSPLVEERVASDEDGKQDDSQEEELEEEQDCVEMPDGSLKCTPKKPVNTGCKDNEVATEMPDGSVKCTPKKPVFTGCKDNEDATEMPDGSVKCTPKKPKDNCKEMPDGSRRCPPKPGQKVDCAGAYGGWTRCSKDCGRGSRSRNFYAPTKPQNGGKPCPPAQTEACNTQACPPPPKEDNCFPADALVETPVGPKAMSEVRVGDVVRSVDGAGRAFFDTVYFFGHADASSTGTYVDVKLQGDHVSLQISQKHFLPICPSQNPCDWTEHIAVYAQDVKLGDYVWVVVGERLDMRLVQGLSVVSRKGLYNPYTLNGKVVVNSVVASAHSNWVLDSWTPAAWTQYLPAVYQTLFLPGRWLYYMVGPVAADVLDMNNPQVAPEKHGHGPEFLLSCAMVASLALVFISSKDLS